MSVVPRLAGACGCVAVGGLGWALADGSPAFYVVRLLAALVVAVSLTGVWRRDGGTALLSPLSLLSVQSLVMYSFVPWLLIDLHRIYMVNTNALLSTYLGSRAEVLVLAVAALLAYTALSVPVDWRGWKIGQPIFKGAGTVWVAGLGFAAVAGFMAFRFIPGADGPGLARQIRDGLLPIALVAAALLHVHWLGRPGLHARFVAAVLILAAGLLLGGVGKPVFYTLASAMLLWLFASPVPLRRRLPILVMLILAGLCAVTIFSLIRDPGGQVRLQRSAEELPRGLTEKVVDRQLETGWCFNNLMTETWRLGEPARAFYFVGAVVPRMLWPDKPSLSVGRDLGVQYCAKDPAWNHSASVTLLGEPVLQAGGMGLAAALVFLVAGLAGLTVMGAWAGPAGLAIWIGLSPWLVDFDQTFAMYVANAVKMLLYTSPLWGAVVLCHRRNRSCAA